MVRRPRMARNMSVGTDAQAGLVDGFLGPVPGLAVRGDGAEHEVGVPADVFRAGLDREVDALVERAEIERARPRVVHEHDGVAGVRHLGDGGNVLDVERSATPGSRRTPRGYWAAPALRFPPQWWARSRSSICCSGQDGVAHLAGGEVGAVGHEHMVAGAQDRQQRRWRWLTSPDGSTATPSHRGPSMSVSAFWNASEVGVPRRPY